MRDPARELPDRLHLLRLPQLLLQRPPLRHVFGERLEAFDAAPPVGPAHRPPRQPHQDAPPVATLPHHLHAFHGVRAVELREDALPLRRVGVHVTRQVRGQQLLLRVVAQHPDERRIDREQPPVERGAVDPVGRVLHEGAAALLRPPQRLLEAAALGDVVRHPDHARHLAVRLPDRGVPDVEYHPVDLDHRGERVPGERAAHVRLGLRHVGVQLGDRPPDELGRPHTERVEPLPFDHREHGVAVQREQHQRRTGDHGTQPRLVLPQRALLTPPLGDVARVHDQLGGARVGQAGLADGLEQPPRAVVRPEPELRGLGTPGTVDGARQRLRDGGDVVRVDEVEGIALQQVAGLVAEHALDRRAGVAEHAVFPNDRHDVRRVLDEGAEVLLALAQRRFSARAIDGGGKHVRHRLEEVGVVDRELAAPCRMNAQHAEGPLLPMHHDAEAGGDAVLRQQRGAPEPRIAREVLHHHRPGRAQHVARVRVGVRRYHRATDAPLAPPHARAQQ